MSYYFTTTIKNSTFNNVLEKIQTELKKEGFGILTEIDLKTTLKNKLDVDLYNYKILGACNPQFAYKAISAEDKIGTMLPCNIIVQEKEPGSIEVSAINPIESMQAIENESLAPIAIEVKEKLERFISNL